MNHFNIMTCMLKAGIVDTSIAKQPFCKHIPATADKRARIELLKNKEQ
jgi:hypothetical protein